MKDVTVIAYCVYLPFVVLLTYYVATLALRYKSKILN